MIIDQTFMWLYATYKVGLALTPLAILSTIALIATVGMFIASHTSDEDKQYIPTIRKVLYWLIPVCFFTSTVAIMTPNVEDVKAYAIYAISKEVSNSPQAKELFDAGIQYLENKTK